MSDQYPIAIRDWSAPVERYGIIVPTRATGIQGDTLNLAGVTNQPEIGTRRMTASPSTLEPFHD